MYFNAIKNGDYIYSVDMVRYKIEFKNIPMEFKIDVSLNPFTGEKIRTAQLEPSRQGGEQFLREIMNDSSIANGIYADSWLSTKPNTYRTLVVIPSGQSKITIGVGWIDMNYKINPNVGFIEFNPNKVMYDVRTKEVFKRLRWYICDLSLVRYDLAIDIPISRELLSLEKDKRKYRIDMKSNEDKTEYLGVRNTDTFVKLYNKQIESNLEYPLTRLELTLEKLDMEYIEKKIPCLRGTSSEDIPIEFSETDKLLIELLRKEEMPEIQIRRLNKEKQKKIRPFVLSNQKAVPFNALIFDDIKKTIEDLI